MQMVNTSPTEPNERMSRALIERPGGELDLIACLDDSTS
jgi:hypothetical protein